MAPPPLPRPRQLAARFAKFDVDGNGELSKDEFREFYKTVQSHPQVRPVPWARAGWPAWVTADGDTCLRVVARAATRSVGQRCQVLTPVHRPVPSAHPSLAGAERAV